MTLTRVENKLSAFTLLILPLICGCGARANDGAEMPVDKGTVAQTDGAGPPVIIARNGKMIRFSGRFDTAGGGPAVCAWPASAMTVRFRGPAIDVNMGLGANRFVVELDGKPIKKLVGDENDKGSVPASRWYRLAENLPAGDHSVTLVKATEPNVGNASMALFMLPNGGEALPPIPPKRRIEVIGDSISAGYGIEAASQDDHFSPATENAYLTYGALTARAVKADYTCIAWSGRTMWPTFTIPEIYDRVLPQKAEPKWPAAAPKPDVYLINLATNDFSRKDAPEEEAWVKAYKDFVAKLRAGAPDAVIYCATSPMMNDAWPAGRKARTTAGAWIRRVVREFNAAGDRKVKFLEFDQQNGAVDGLGADWHPSVKTNQKMAAVFTAALKAELGW